MKICSSSAKSKNTHSFIPLAKQTFSGITHSNIPRSISTSKSEGKLTSTHLFEPEIKKAIDWLMNIQDTNVPGWGWLQHIPPNEQNTAEVICAILVQDKHLIRPFPEKLYLSINTFILKPEECAKITIDWLWVLRALNYISHNINLFEGYDLPHESLNKARDKCISWLLENQDEKGAWSNSKGDPPSVSRTALTIISLCENNKVEDLTSDIQNSLTKAEKWLISRQERNGSWGNIGFRDAQRLYATNPYIPYDNFEHQYMSNPACTAYAILALTKTNGRKHQKLIKKAVNWLESQQNTDTGCWNVFHEVGLREGNIYTFRHFSTAWVIQAMLESECRNFKDESVLKGTEYILQLQDPISGGWRTSSDTDPFTWATCNVLELLRTLQIHISKIPSSELLVIIHEWRRLKLIRNIKSWHCKGIIVSFNQTMSLMFAIVFSLLCGCLMIMLSHFININSLRNLLMIIMIFLFGIPWVFYLRYSRERMTWITSIAWVVGTIISLILSILGIMKIL